MLCRSIDCAINLRLPLNQFASVCVDNQFPLVVSMKSLSGSILRRFALTNPSLSISSDPFNGANLGWPAGKKRAI
jgi:hypothetical protein